MPTYVAFLRAVNVGGRIVRMAELRKVLEDNGFRDVETHIQTGNIRVTTSMRSASKVEATLEQAIAGLAGFEVPTIVRTPKQLRAVAREVAETPALLPGDGRRYVCFVKAPPTAEGAVASNAWNLDGERVKVLAAGDILVELTIPTHEARVGNNRLEKTAQTVATMRDIKVVRTLDEKWGA